MVQIQASSAELKGSALAMEDKTGTLLVRRAAVMRGVLS
jgi:hypothetical protein